MRPSLLVLKLVLDELGIDADVSTSEKRAAIQNAVYLAQHAGVDLGHRHGWVQR